MDQVNAAIVSVRKVQDRFPNKPEKFRQILGLIVEAYKQAVSDRCVLCEIAGKASNASLEQHHIAGRNNQPDSLPVCVPCHNLLSEKQKKWQSHKDDSCIQLSSYFNGLSDICELLWETTGQEHLQSLSSEFTNRAWSIRNSSTK